jgi:hypothetical protein
MNKPEYIAHLRSLGLCKDMAEGMAGQATSFSKGASAQECVYIFAVWASETEEGQEFWESFAKALYLAEQQDDLDLIGVK